MLHHNNWTQTRVRLNQRIQLGSPHLSWEVSKDSSHKKLKICKLNQSHKNFISYVKLKRNLNSLHTSSQRNFKKTIDLRRSWTRSKKERLKLLKQTNYLRRVSQISTTNNSHKTHFLRILPPLKCRHKMRHCLNFKMFSLRSQQTSTWWDLSLQIWTMWGHFHKSTTLMWQETKVKQFTQDLKMRHQQSKWCKWTPHNPRDSLSEINIIN